MSVRREPTHDFFGALRKLNALLDRRDRLHLAALVALMVGSAVLEVFGVGAIPAFVGLIVSPEMLTEHPPLDRIVPALGIESQRELLVWGVGGLIVIFAVKNGFLVFNYYWQKRFIADRRVHFARRLVDAYMNAPYTFHLTRNTSELIRNVERETSLIAGQVLTPILEVATRALIMIAVLIFLLVAEPGITIVWLLLFGLLAAAGVKALSRRLERLGLEEQHHRQRVVQRLTEGFGSIKESRILNREGFFADAINHSILRMAEAIRFKQFTTSAVPPLTELFAVAGLAAIAATLMFLGRPTETILVTLALFAVGLVRLRETVSAAMAHLTNLRYNIVAVDPVYADLTALEEVSRPPPIGSEPRALRRSIELDDVTFRYDTDEPYALEDIRLSIPAGGAVAFVGGTGAGKSTLVDLILGLLTPERGVIRVDGEDIHDGRLRDWQRRIGYVPQSIYLLDDTIRRNIALGIEDHEIDSGRLVAAVRAAQLERLLERLPEGLETMIGEAGVRLSGGERQRIGIARALYHDPDVLIMDEATSALDNTTERAIIEAVEALKGQRTIIMIAHRLSTVRNCDTLFFLNEGRIEASGPFDDLAAESESFRVMARGS